MPVVPTTLGIEQSAITAVAARYLYPAAIGIFALVLALPYLDHAPMYDEFYSLLAARGWLETGAPVIADGEYTRAFAFTALQAMLFSVFGESFIVARLPSVVAVVALALSIYYWVRSVGGLGEALIAAIVFATAPLTISMAQFGRFYAVHALVVWSASLLVFSIVSAPGTRRAAILKSIAAALLLLLAFDLQTTTLLAVCALGLWASPFLAQAALRAQWSARTKALVGGAFFLGIAALGFAGLVATDLGTSLWGTFRSTALWAAPRADNLRFYHQAFSDDLGILWSLFPLLAISAVISKPRAALFACSFVAVAVILHSLAAQKAGRYIFYVMPFLASVIGIGLAPALRAAYRWAVRGIEGLLPTTFARHGSVRWAVAGLIVIALAFPIANNSSTKDVLRMLGGAPNVESVDYSWVADWPVEIDLLRRLASETEVLVTSSGMKAVYYLGDFDFEMNANVASETDTGMDFGTDPRTGRVVFSRPEALALLMECYADVTFVIDQSRWWRDGAVPIATSALLERSAERIVTRPESALMVFRARSATASDRSEGCEKVRLPARAHARYEQQGLGRSRQLM